MSRHGRSRRSDKEGRHQGDFIFLLVITFVVFLTAANFFSLANGDADDEPVMFSATLDDINDKYPVQMRTEDWLNPVIGAIFLFQFVWLVYGLTLTCKKPDDGFGYLYFRPPFVPKSLYVAFLISLLFLIAFLWMRTEELLVHAFFFMVGVAVFAVAAFGISAYALRVFGCDLIRLGRRHEIALDRGFVQNGLGAYAAWAVFNATLNLAGVLTWKWDVNDQDSSTIGLSVFGGLILLYFLLDVTAFSVALRYVLSPYMVFVVIMAAIFSKGWSSFSERNSLVSLILLSFAAFILLFRIGIMIAQACINPEPLDDLCVRTGDKKKRKKKVSESESEAGTTTTEEESTEEEESEEEESSEDEDKDAEKGNFKVRAKILLSK